MMLKTTRNGRWTRLHAVLMLCVWMATVTSSTVAAAVDPSAIPTVPDSTDTTNEPPSQEIATTDQSSTGGMTTFAKVGVAGIVAAAVGSVGASGVVSGALANIGFTSGGITAGSWAAKWMSASAIANNGGVVAGSVVAKLQSIATVGLGAGASAVIGAAVVGGASVVIAKSFAGRQHEAISALEPAESLGKLWVVAASEGWGSVYVARYESEDTARDAFGHVWCPSMWCAKMLFDPYGREMEATGQDDRSDAIREVMRSNYFRAVYMYKEIGMAMAIATVLAVLIYRLR